MGKNLANLGERTFWMTPSTYATTVEIAHDFVMFSRFTGPAYLHTIDPGRGYGLWQFW